MAILLLLFLVESQALGHQCSTAVFPHCTNNSVLRVTKSTEMYQVTLQATEWQCFNEFCLLNDQKYRQKNIMCNDVCGVCRQLQPPEHNYDCGMEVKNCEVSVDTYLDRFCAQATSTRNRATICASATITAELPCSTSTIIVHSVQLTTMTVPTSPKISPTLPCQRNMADPMTSVIPQTYIPSLAPQTLTKSVVSVAVLGALLVLSLLLLMVVTTGWVCTYISMTKREAKKNSTHTRVADLDDNDDDKTNEERLFHNPTFDDTHTSIIQPHETEPTQGPTGSFVNDKNFSKTTYDSINLPTQPTADDGQTYDVLNRSQANGNSSAPVLVVERLYNNKDYSQLALQDK